MPKVFPKLLCPKTFPCVSQLSGVRGQYGPTESMLDRSAVTTGVLSSLVCAENQLSIVSVSAAEEKLLSCYRSSPTVLFVSRKLRL